MGHHHHKKGHGIVGHHAPHHAMPCEVQPVPDDVHVGIQFTAEAIIAATSKRCKLLGQGGCGRVIAADMPFTAPAAANAITSAAAHAGNSPASSSSSSSGQPAAVSSSAPARPSPTSTTSLLNPSITSSSSTDSIASAWNAATAPPCQRVAIKTALPPHHGGPRQHSRSLMVEARALRLAAHPAVIKLLGSCWSDELDALVFELLSGGDLQGRMGISRPAAGLTAAELPAAAPAAGKLPLPPPQQQQHRSSANISKQQQPKDSTVKAVGSSSSKFLSWQQRLLISYQLASALASLHSSRPQQLLHRDMKPENVLLDDENNARLTDFGIATVVPVGELAQLQHQQHGLNAASNAHGSLAVGCATLPKSPVAATAAAAAAAAASKPVGWGGGGGLAAVGGAATPPKSPVTGAGAAGSSASAWGAAAHGVHATALSPPATSVLKNTMQQQHLGQGGAAAAHHQQQQQHHHQQQQRHHGSSSCTSAAADAVLARLAARGVGGAAAAAAGVAKGSGGSSVGGSRPGSTPTVAAARGGVMVVHHGWAGTHDYLDPMYEQLGQLCDKSDVYGLGLIMCQLIMDAASDPKQAKRVLQHTAHEQKVLHLPPSTADWPKESALEYAELALHCAAADRKQRPTAAQLAAALHQLVLKAADSSTATGPINSSSSSSDNACPAFSAVKHLLPGKYGLVPSCLHGGAAADPAAAAAAAAQAHSCLVAAAAAASDTSSSSSSNTGKSSSNSSSSAGKIGKAADASWGYKANMPNSAASNRSNTINSSSNTSSSSSFASKKQAAEAAKLQEQHAKKLQLLTKRIMSLELLLHPSGAIAGGSITATAPAGAAAAAMGAASNAGSGGGCSSSASSAAAAVAYAAGWTGVGTAGLSGASTAHANSKGATSSASCSAAGSTAAAIAMTPSPVAFRVLGGCYSASTGSIVFCCNSGRAAAGMAQGSNHSSNSSAGGSWYVFAGSYKDGRLLGAWKLADATVVAAESASVASASKAAGGSTMPGAQSLLRIASSSSSSDSAAALAVVASYDWVTHHTYRESADSRNGMSSGSFAASSAQETTAGKNVAAGQAAAASSNQLDGEVQQQQQPGCAAAGGSVPAYRSASGSLMLPVC